MTTQVLSYTLPTMQLVCYLVSSGNSSINGSDPGFLPEPTTTLRPLPAGYVIYPEWNAAYKVSNDTLSWTDAKSRCVEDGGYLAELDSFEKIQAVRRQTASTRLTHVGFELVNGTWHSVKTGLTASNLPWATSEPYGGGNCSDIKYTTIGLGQYGCSNAGDYVCEIPYP